MFFFCSLFETLVRYVVVDPVLSYGTLYPVYIIQIWLSWAFAWSLLATFLIAFFWFKLSFSVSQKLSQNGFVLWISAIVFSLLILSVEVRSTQKSLSIVYISFRYKYVPLMIIVFGDVYILDAILGRVIAQSLCYWFLSAFFISSGCRILYLLNKAADLRRQTSGQRTMARFMVADAVLLTSFGAFVYAFTTPTATTSVAAFFALYSVEFAFLASISSVQIWMFKLAPKCSEAVDSGDTTSSGKPIMISIFGNRARSAEDASMSMVDQWETTKVNLSK